MKKKKKAATKKKSTKKTVRKKVTKRPAKKKAVKKATKRPKPKKRAKNKPATKSKKKAVKKTKAKTKPKKRAKKIKEAPPELCFWINNGPVVKSLSELRRALKQINDDQFSFHTERNGNDFANWVSGVLGEKACAKLLKKTKTRTGTIRALGSFIK